jgi:hypothetical protein
MRGVTPALSACRRPLHRRLVESGKPTASPRRSPETRIHPRRTISGGSAALDLLRVGSLAAGIELIEEIAFAFSDHSLSQRNIAAGHVGAGLKDVHRLPARGGLLNRSLDGV